MVSTPFKPGRPMSINTSRRTELLDELHGVRAVLGLAHHAKFVRPVQDGLDAIAHDLVIIHEQDVEWHSGWKQLYPFPSCIRTRAPLARRADEAGTRRAPAPWLARCRSLESALRLFRSRRCEPGKHARRSAAEAASIAAWYSAAASSARERTPWPSTTPKARDFVPRTGTGRSSIRFDPPGNGASSRLTVRISLDRLLQDLSDFVDLGLRLRHVRAKQLQPQPGR